MIFLIAMAESLAVIGLIVPGVVLLFGIAAIAGSGVLGVWPVLAAAFFGAIVGDGLSFFVGRYFHQHLQRYWPFRSHPQWIENGERFFLNHGGKSIIFGRFIGPIRPFIPMVAGMMDMPAGRFIATNIISALAWAPVYLLPGYYIGASVQAGDELTQNIMLWILFGTMGGWALLWLLQRALQQLAFNGSFYLKAQRWASARNVPRLVWLRYQQPFNTTRGSAAAGTHQNTLGWFPLGAAALIVLCVVLLISLITIMALELPSLVQLNVALREWLQELRGVLAESTSNTSLAEPFFSGITWLGDYRLFAALLIACTLYSVKHQNKWTVNHAWAISVAGAAAVLGLKGWLQVTRPSALSHGIDAYSFPSGHMVLATLLVGFGGYLVCQYMQRQHHWKVYLVAAIAILLTAISRLYLDAHWFSDVLAGALLGLLCCASAAFSYHRYSKQSS